MLHYISIAGNSAKNRTNQEIQLYKRFITTPSTWEKHGKSIVKIIQPTPNPKKNKTKGLTITEAIIPIGINFPNVDRQIGTVVTCAPKDAHKDDETRGWSIR